MGLCCCADCRLSRSRSSGQEDGSSLSQGQSFPWVWQDYAFSCPSKCRPRSSLIDVGAPAPRADPEGLFVDRHRAVKADATGPNRFFRIVKLFFHGFKLLLSWDFSWLDFFGRQSLFVSTSKSIPDSSCPMIQHHLLADLFSFNAMFFSSSSTVFQPFFASCCSLLPE